MHVHTVLGTDNWHFPTNSSTFWCRRTRISTQMRSDFPHDSAVIFRMIPCAKNLGRNPVWVCAENGKNPAGTCVRSYVQCFYIHSEHASFISGVKWPKTWKLTCTFTPTDGRTRACYLALHTTYVHTTLKETTPTWYIEESIASEVLVVHRSLGLPAHFINRVTHLPLCCGTRFQLIFIDLSIICAWYLNAFKITAS